MNNVIKKGIRQYLFFKDLWLYIFYLLKQINKPDFLSTKKKSGINNLKQLY
ncbi:hypothetical protein HMPREF0766_13266 [Sphingobacterium spiritivorum ATCC 33861]|uniref:Uncharacterized protein n=1 Tax=Sphingobacterium spiritivorum ATCC 33861 TaxID=525373 RepID=D7VQL2_SPHSI|nr:hypothetical protein HMPREF0766_13266 [Sphingobacterium spiritivorum ATCC 33861]